MPLPFNPPFYGPSASRGSASSLLDGLVLYYSLEEDGAAARVDRLGVNNLTAFNAPAGVEAHVGSGAEFDFDTQTYLQRTEAGDLPNGTEPWTIALWWKPYNAYPTANEYAWVFNLTYGWWGGNMAGFRFQLKSDGVTSGFVFDGAGGAPMQSSPVLHRSLIGEGLFNTWIFDWFSYDGTTFRAQRNRTGTIDAVAYRGLGTAGPRYLCIGGHGTLHEGNILPGAYLDGIVDEVGMWNRVLSSDELDALWNGGAGLAPPFA